MSSGKEEHIHLFVTYAAIVSHLPFNVDDAWRQAVAIQAAEEWEVPYETVYNWLGRSEVAKMAEKLTSGQFVIGGEEGFSSST